MLPKSETHRKPYYTLLHIMLQQSAQEDMHLSFSQGNEVGEKQQPHEPELMGKREAVKNVFHSAEQQQGAETSSQKLDLEELGILNPESEMGKRFQAMMQGRAEAIFKKQTIQSAADTTKDFSTENYKHIFISALMAGVCPRVEQAILSKTQKYLQPIVQGLLQGNQHLLPVLNMAESDLITLHRTKEKEK
jgi:hypothetical protein